MLDKLKLYLYPVLVFLVIWFAWGFYRNYTSMRTAQAQAASEETNAPVEQTNVPVAQETNAAPDTNAISFVTTNADGTVETNTVVVTTNANGTAVTNVVSIGEHINKPAATNADSKRVASNEPKPVKQANGGSVMGSLFGFVLSAILLGCLIAYDVTQYMGQQAVDFLFNDEGEGQRNPEYEHAEQVWANGNHLEAIQLMRDYLKKNPREQYVALRIAEIYEKDLKNPLAAALEYEEILKQKLPPEHWGKAAIHLCNIYSKLGKQDQMQALLQRIITEHPQTAAAKKARSKLGLPEDADVAALTAEEETATSEPAPAAEATEPAPPSNLPPGFRPKK